MWCYTLVIISSMKRGNMSDFIPETREEIDKASQPMHELAADNVAIDIVDEEESAIRARDDQDAFLEHMYEQSLRDQCDEPFWNRQEEI